MNNQFININSKQYRGEGFITISKYNNYGDIIYIADKDSKIITSIETQNYTLIRIFSGHNGIVWSLDLSTNDKIMISASGDLTICFWDTQTGNKIFQSNENCIPKYVCTQKNLNTNYVGIICEALTKKTLTYISIYDLDEINKLNFLEKTRLYWVLTSKPTSLLWLNEHILIVGCNDGKIILKDINVINGTTDKEYLFHNDSIKSIVWNKNKTEILTGSLDCTSKQINISNWEVKSTYKSSVPINWACWNNNDKKVLIGGGIEAMNVAKSSNNDLNLKIFRCSDQKLINQINSHFGPIRYIDKSPLNKNFITASQDGTVKIYFINDENTNTNITNDDNNIKKNINKFCLDKNKILSDEINKLENVNAKIKIIDIKEKKWIPGMPKSSDNKNINDNFYDIKSDLKSNLSNPNLYKSNSNNNLYQTQNSTIRITNLPYYIQKKELADIFDLYGRIIEKNGIKIIKYDNTTIAFITYVNHDSAIKAIENLHRMVIEHYIIGVELAESK